MFDLNDIERLMKENQFGLALEAVEQSRQYLLDEKENAEAVLFAAIDEVKDCLKTRYRHAEEAAEQAIATLSTCLDDEKEALNCTLEALDRIQEGIMADAEGTEYFDLIVAYDFLASNENALLASEDEMTDEIRRQVADELDDEFEAVEDFIDWPALVTARLEDAQAFLVGDSVLYVIE